MVVWIAMRGLLHACISSKYIEECNPRANGAKRRSGRKPGGEGY